MSSHLTSQAFTLATELIATVHHARALENAPERRISLTEQVAAELAEYLPELAFSECSDAATDAVNQRIEGLTA